MRGCVPRVCGGGSGFAAGGCARAVVVGGGVSLGGKHCISSSSGKQTMRVCLCALLVSHRYRVPPPHDMIGERRRARGTVYLIYERSAKARKGRSIRGRL